MKSRFFLALFIICGVVLVGSFQTQVCATVEKEVKIQSEPSGADVFLARGRKRIPLGQTPLVTKLEFHSNISVIRMVFKKRGYKESTLKVKATQDIVIAELESMPITQQPGTHSDPYLTKLQKELNPTITKILPPLLEKQYKVAFRLNGPVNVTGKKGNAYLVLPFVIEDFKEIAKGPKKGHQTRTLQGLWRELGVNIAEPLAKGIKSHKEVKGVILDTRFDDTIFTHKVSPKVKTKQEMECVPGNRTQMVMQFQQVPYYRTEYRNGISTQVLAGYKSESRLVPQEVYDPCLYRRPVTKRYVAFDSKLALQKNQGRALFLLRSEVLKKRGEIDDIYGQLSILLTDASGRLLARQGTMPDLPIYLAKGSQEKTPPLSATTAKQSKHISSTSKPKPAGKKDLERADLLNQQLIKLYKNYQYQEALIKAEELMAIYDKVFKPDDPFLVTYIELLASLYRDLGQLEKAEPLFKRALSINEKAYGSDHADVAQSLNSLAMLYEVKGDYGKAEQIYKRALTIRERTLGPEHSLTAVTLSNLAKLYLTLGNYNSSEQLYKRALAINEKSFGMDHPNVALCLSSLAAINKALGNFEKAELLYKKSLAIYEKSIGSDNIRTATVLNNLAALYETSGNYMKAEPIYKKSLAIHEKALGPDNPSTASVLNNLAFLYDLIGDYEKAEPLFKRALAIHEKAFGPDHPDVAVNLNNLGVLYVYKGDYIKAEPLLIRALAIREKAFGPEHPDTTQSLNNMAQLYEHMGMYKKAESQQKRVLTIKEKIFGPDHQSVAVTLNNLAVHYSSLGAPKKAEPYFKRALAVREKALGSEHPDVSQSLNNLAFNYSMAGEFQKAHSLYKKAQSIDDKIIEQVTGFTSEDQKIKFLAKKEGDLHTFLSLVVQHLSDQPAARKDALDVWLRRKGVILESQKRFQETLVHADDPKAVRTFKELANTRTQLAKLTFAGPGKEGPVVFKKQVAELTSQKKTLDAKLSQLSHSFAVQRKVAKADSQKIARALPPDTVLLEFAQVEMINFMSKGNEDFILTPHYIVFILHKGKEDDVRIIDLGRSQKIDKAIAQFKSSISNTRDTTGIGAIKASRTIYSQVFKPLKNELKGAKEIFISPDGNLNLIPFEVLQGPDSRFLIEDYTFNYLAAGRDLLSFGEIKEKGSNALLMGDPDFDFSVEKRKSETKDSVKTSMATLSVEMRGMGFSRLPGTRAEVRAIYALLGQKRSKMYKGKEATEEMLMNFGPPSVLHLATHGFFLSDLQLEKLRDDSLQRGMQLSSAGSKPMYSGKRVQVGNPLVRSGIALAGANKAFQSRVSAQNDGIVTAEEILGLRLRGTDMVVLSACDTGLGEVKSGEGVFGLRRAFTQAGAKSLVMSMWPVPDRETKELMVEFYTRTSRGKTNRSQALRQAVLQEMKIVKKRYGYTNPAFWGAFVFMGEP